MSKIKTAKKLICNNRSRFLSAIIEYFGFLFPDVLYSKILFRLRVGYKLNLDNPKTFNEKLQWIKLFDHNPLYTVLVDKYAVKDYVGRIIGEEHIIPTLGIWERPEDIDFDLLPEQFVLKTTHGGGNLGVFICKDKTHLDKTMVIKKMKKAMKQNLYRKLREWPYKNVPKRILAEKFMSEPNTHELRDYKFFCFNGDVKSMFIATDRNTGNVKFDYFDRNFNHLELIQSHPMSGKHIEKPANFEEMVEIASKLSKGLPQVRVDLYTCNSTVYFGELTFCHHGGITPFHPSKWDEQWGGYISLPKKYK